MESKKKRIECKKCPGIWERRNIIVQGHGDDYAQIMFIGLAPGRKGADLTGVPFTKDASGVIFQKAMIESGFSKEIDPLVINPFYENAYVTNLIKCNPKDLNGNNRNPSREEIQNCREHLQREIAAINPKIIVAMGKIVSEDLLNIKIKSFSSFHNNPIERDGKIILPFIHPSYVARGAYDLSKYITEFSSIRRLI